MNSKAPSNSMQLDKVDISIPHARVRGIETSIYVWGILGFSCLVLLGCFAGLGKIINYFFPIAAAIISGVLYLKNPVLYFTFSWWICFLSPFVRRIADFKGSYTDPSPILLAPYLVALVPAIYIFRQIPNTVKQGGQPFVLPIAGVLYSFSIALFNRPIAIAGRGLIDWIAPVFFGYSIFINWKCFPKIWHATKNNFTWAALLLGSYGITQYLISPEWDAQWIINSKFDALAPGFSQPAPLGIRVFSTLNSQEPFSAVIVPTLLIALNSNLPVAWPAFISGILSLLLSFVRSGILALGSSLVVLITGSKLSSNARLLFSGSILFICLMPLLSMDEFRDIIQARLETLQDLDNDGSINIRRDSSIALLDSALSNFIGDGIGGPTFDNALISILMNLGWIGAIPYLSGIVVVVIKLFKNDSTGSISIIRAVIFSCLVRLPVNSPMLEVSGMILWGFMGLGLSAVKFHEYQRIKVEDYKT
jgi:hypothetical protein